MAKPPSLFDIMPDIPCQAMVDRLDMQLGGGSWQWQVTVRTAPFWPKLTQKVYLIEAPSDTLAAQEGIRRFVEENKQARALRNKLITVH